MAVAELRRRGRVVSADALAEESKGKFIGVVGDCACNHVAARGAGSKLQVGAAGLLMIREADEHWPTADGAVSLCEEGGSSKRAMPDKIIRMGLAGSDAEFVRC